MTRIVLSHGEPATEVGKNALSDLRKKYSTKDVTFTSINLGKSKEEVYNTLKQFENEPVEVLMAFGFALHQLRPFTIDILQPITSSLRMVTGGGAGYDHINIESFDEKGVYYSNTPNAIAGPTATLASILVLATIRQVGYADHYSRTQSWVTGQTSIGRSLSPNGAILGIVGYGHIGRIIARQCRGFGMVIKYHNRRRLPVEDEDGAEYVDSLEVLLGQSDVVSLSLPLSAATHHFIGKKELAWMKKGSRLINTSRGPVVDEEALVEALKSGHLSAAGLDVYEKEPEIHPWLKDSYKVILTPHIGGMELQTPGDIEAELCDNVDSFLETGVPHNAVNSPKDK